MTTESTSATLKDLPHQEVEDDLSIEYPDSDGEPMAENDHQLSAMLDAISMLRAWYDDRDDVYAGGDMLIYYKINDNETRVAPDVFVVLGTPKHKRKSWIVWREGKAPDIVMELASGSTWRRDMREKRAIYAEMGVIEYWRFDPTSNYFFPPLVGERLGDNEYRTIELTTNKEGAVWGHSLVLGLGHLGDARRESALLRSSEWALAPYPQPKRGRPSGKRGCPTIRDRCAAGRDRSAASGGGRTAAVAGAVATISSRG